MEDGISPASFLSVERSGSDHAGATGPPCRLAQRRIADRQRSRCPMIRTTALLAFWILAAPIAAIIGFPATLVTGNVRILYSLFMWGCRAGIWRAGEHIEAVGLEHFAHSKGYLFMTNHVSNLDPPIQIPLIPRQ